MSYYNSPVHYCQYTHYLVPQLLCSSLARSRLNASTVPHDPCLHTPTPKDPLSWVYYWGTLPVLDYPEFLPSSAPA